MLPRLFLIVGLLAVSACAHNDPPLPTCDGSVRRPANPHGSVLVTAQPPQQPAPSSASASASTGGCA
nr:hypothetical protein [uncultured Brevundimonas sp.]